MERLHSFIDAWVYRESFTLLMLRTVMDTNIWKRPPNSIEKAERELTSLLLPPSSARHPTSARPLPSQLLSICTNPSKDQHPSFISTFALPRYASL